MKLSHIFTAIIILSLSAVLPISAQRPTTVPVWQFCIKVAQLTHQPCRVVLRDLQTFMNTQPVVQITTPLTLLTVDLSPVTIPATPHEHRPHRKGHHRDSLHNTGL